MTPMRKTVMAVTAAAALLCGAVGARADGAVVLTPGQLDRVTAGGATVFASTDAAALGALSLTGTTANSVVTSGSPHPQAPNLTNSAAAADGAAYAVGTNVGVASGPTGSATSVVTGGTADGNQVFNSTINHTVQGAGGVTFQAGWTFVYGGWSGI